MFTHFCLQNSRLEGTRSSSSACAMLQQRFDALAVPFQRRELRRYLSSGQNRDNHCISLKELRISRIWKRLALQQVRIALEDNHDDDGEELLRAIDMLKIYCTLVFRKRRPRLAPVVRNLTLENVIIISKASKHVHESDHLSCSRLQVPEFCGSEYRFRTRADLIKKFRLLQIPAQCGPFQNRGKVPGEKCFLYFLRRMCSTMTIKQLIESEFGGEKSTWSRAFFWLVSSDGP